MRDANGIDVERARADTPGCEHVAHLDNAGCALAPRCVLDAVIGHLQREAEIGGYEAAAERHERVEHTYDALAGLIGCHRDEVAVVESATRAWDMALYAFDFVPGDRLLTSAAEYASNLVALDQVARRTGAIVELIPDDPTGQIDVDALEAMLDDRVRLVSLVHVPTHGGLVNPAARVGAITKAAGIPLLLDACQSVGQMPVDVAEIGCDILAATGRKFLRGPRGTGFLYVRRDLIERLEPPMLDLHAVRWLPGGRYVIRSDARRFETWETNHATKIGLGVAVDYASRLGLEAIRRRVFALAADLRQSLRDIPGVEIHDRGAEHCAIVSFSVAGQPARAVADALGEEAVNVSVSVSRDGRLELASRGLEAVVRASVHYYNTDAELNDLAAVVDRVR